MLIIKTLWEAARYTAEYHKYKFVLLTCENLYRIHSNNIATHIILYTDYVLRGC